MDKTNFLLYKDFKPNVDILSDEQAGKLFKAVFQYVQDRTEPDFTSDGMLLMAFTMLKTTLERDLKKYKKQVEINKTNGKKGGRPPKEAQETHSVNDKPKEPNGLNENRNNPSEPKKADSDSVTDSDSVRDIDTDKKDKDTVPYKKVVDYINELANKNWTHTAKKTQKLIKARFNEGFTYEQAISAIDESYKHWSKSGKLDNMHPTVIFNGDFERRVDGGMYSFDKTKPKTKAQQDKDNFYKSLNDRFDVEGNKNEETNI